MTGHEATGCGRGCTPTSAAPAVYGMRQGLGPQARQQGLGARGLGSHGHLGRLQQTRCSAQPSPAQALAVPSNPPARPRIHFKTLAAHSRPTERNEGCDRRAKGQSRRSCPLLPFRTSPPVSQIIPCWACLSSSEVRFRSLLLPGTVLPIARLKVPTAKKQEPFALLLYKSSSCDV